MLNFGESALVSHGVDIRSEINETRSSISKVLSRGYSFYRIGSMIDNGKSREIESFYSKIEMIVLSACERIQNVTSFDEQDRHRLYNMSITARTNKIPYN
ncbi:hypothetical protein (partial), partial [Candidatus Ichthyocystis hellenicum]